ncbi:GDSL esterase/lipase At5g03980 [Cornus florida]|uniref:GDSL esterase/lipase At5g03980 n=1 Tax=Cornus florida TaxID=4283 RepID=UPI002898050E|nr:GDSL esterase/lipase At5g03980 [Cornus florida]
MASSRYVLFLITLSLFLFTCAAQHTICPFQSIYQFGDSISDTGNLIRKGPVAARSYAARPPYGHSHGVNFAVAGSTALDGAFFATRNIHTPTSDSPLSLQLNWFRTHLNSLCHTPQECAARLRRSLILMGEIGGNDYNYAFFQNKPIHEIRTYVPHVVGTIVNSVREVIRLGAVRVVVPGNFPVGCIPIYLSSFPSSDPRAYDDMGCLSGLNEFALFHNNYLQHALALLRTEFPNVVILYADYYSAFQSVLRRAPYLGFDRRSLLRACCGVGGLYNYDGSRMCGTPGVPVCPNPAEHIHWDGVHLTQEAYRHMSQILISDILSRIQCVW